MPELLSVHANNNNGSEDGSIQSSGSATSVRAYMKQKSGSFLGLSRLFRGNNGVNHMAGNSEHHAVGENKDSDDTQLSLRESNASVFSARHDLRNSEFGSSNMCTSPSLSGTGRSGTAGLDHMPKYQYSQSALKLGSPAPTSVTPLDTSPHPTQHPAKYLQKQIETIREKEASKLRQESHYASSSSGSGKKSLRLKRFFKIPHSSSRQGSKGFGNGDEETADAQETNVPATAVVTDRTTVQMTLYGAEDAHALIRKYGMPGKLLGEGVSGSVSVITGTDGQMFAVKRFRPRGPRETSREHARKVTSEFCTGSTLHHENIIETLDLLQEGSLFLVVLEYCPYDFFTLVMSDLMTKAEISCFFKQICRGVQYLHSQGLAHRDLKLDNCVVSAKGVLKLIDFGSAVVFQYKYDDTISLAKGVVGSDPYLAPELFTQLLYDPRPVDIWSIAVIYYCMVLKRFPWKKPSTDVPSFRFFSQEPEGPEDRTKGPYRLLKSLPRDSRPLIGRMLELDPKKRINIDEVVLDPWFESIDVCTSVASSNLHEHHLVTEEEVKELHKRKEEEERSDKKLEKVLDETQHSIKAEN